jgi:hypothetical protein
MREDRQKYLNGKEAQGRKIKKIIKILKLLILQFKS